MRLTSGGTVLGAFPDVSFEEGQADLRPGSLLALFSDGLPETMDGDGRAFHQRRLIEALRAGWERLLRSAAAFRGHREATDDVSVILLRRLG